MTSVELRNRKKIERFTPQGSHKAPVDCFSTTLTTLSTPRGIFILHVPRRRYTRLTIFSCLSDLQWSFLFDLCVVLVQLGNFPITGHRRSLYLRFLRTPNQVSHFCFSSNLCTLDTRTNVLLGTSKDFPLPGQVTCEALNPKFVTVRFLSGFIVNCVFRIGLTRRNHGSTTTPLMYSIFLHFQSSRMKSTCRRLPPMTCVGGTQKLNWKPSNVRLF